VAKLVVNPTSASKKEIPIASRVISIGRDPSNDLVLSDSMVSRRHAILEQREDIFVLRDNNSANGTLVNGDKVEEEKTLRDGDLVAIGSSRLLFQLDDAVATLAGGVDAAVPAAADSGQTPVFALPAGAPSPIAATTGASALSCRSCGKQALLTDRFCRACGGELHKKTSVNCTACGKTVPLPAEFCGHCGHELPKKDRGLATEPHKRSELLGEASGGESKVAAAPVGVRRPRPGKPSPVARRAEESAGFGIRLVAALVDSMILGIPLLVGTLLWGTFALDGREAGPQSIPAGSLALASVAFPLLCCGYYVFFWAARGATPGKSLLGLCVQTQDGDSPIGYQRAVVRLLGYCVSSLIVGMGFVMIAFSDDKRGLHDRVAGTRVMRQL
jgi:uncharacterized RDD family membrane protein YckC